MRTPGGSTAIELVVMLRIKRLSVKSVSPLARLHGTLPHLLAEAQKVIQKKYYGH